MDPNRRDQRYRATLSARLLRGKSETRLATHNVSFRGVFLHTVARAMLRQLVRVELTLPDHHLVRAHAMIVHVVMPTVGSEDPDHPAGVGLLFWGDVDGQARWDAFIQDLTKDPSLRLIRASGAPVPERRSSSRFRMKLEVRLPELPETLGAITRDLSEDGMSVATDANYPPGLKTRLLLMHPSTAEPFPVDVIVRRRIDEPGFVGLGVEFMDKSKQTRMQLWAFLGIPEDDS